MRVTVIFDCVMKRGRHLWISASVDSSSLRQLKYISVALDVLQQNKNVSNFISFLVPTSCF